MSDLARWLLDGVQTAALVWLVAKQIRPGGGTPGSLAWIHRDLEGMREAIRKDSGEIRQAAKMLEKRVERLEDADGMHQKAIREFGEDLRGMRAEVTAMHNEVRVLNANSQTALKAMETMLHVKQALERIEHRLPGPA